MIVHILKRKESLEMIEESLFGKTAAERDKRGMPGETAGDGGAPGLALFIFFLKSKWMNLSRVAAIILKIYQPRGKSRGQ
jgi:hypothetical protein